MEKNSLQSIKLEISKSIKLTPYVKIAFHNILGILKTEGGMKTLLRDLYNDPLVRKNAIQTLLDFNNDEVFHALFDLLNKGISATEKCLILSYIERNGTIDALPKIIELIKLNKEIPESDSVVEKAFNVLQAIGKDSKEALEYIHSIILNTKNDEKFRIHAISALSWSNDISIFEKLLNEKSEGILYITYGVLTLLARNLIDKINKKKIDNNHQAPHSLEDDDKIILEIRVLIGKMSQNFDSYSYRVKAAFINTMASSNHREFLTYMTKALSSNDPELVNIILDFLLYNINRIENIDKLLKTLITLSADTEKNSETIIKIFERYFTNITDTRKNYIFKDKLFNYIVVTLDTYFEKYRKEFITRDVIEKNLPKNLKLLRCFILNHFNPDLLNKTIEFLKHEDRSTLGNILNEISTIISYVFENDKNQLHSLLETLFDNDKKSREVSISFIEDINIEKYYLRNKIIRLCEIIGRLKIISAASSLVVIYNFVKKYPDEVILDAVSYSLSMLNYPYMLGELEVTLSTGDKDEQHKAVHLLSLFSDQRLLNIIIDFLKENIEVHSETIIKLLNILLIKNIQGNASANQVLKSLIELNKNQEIIRLSILCLGKCGNEYDSDYLNDLFFPTNQNTIKEAVVQAFGYILNISNQYNINQILLYLREYLKDPGIRVRILSSSLLIQYGDKKTIGLCRDMMTIKNKNIQREILSIQGNTISTEFSYFLILLLNEGYAISSDIISVIKLLPEEDLKEIDRFIVNILKKYDVLEIDESKKLQLENKIPIIKGLKNDEVTILKTTITPTKNNSPNSDTISKSLISNKIQNFIISIISKEGGILSKATCGDILAYFYDPINAATAALEIFNYLKITNKFKLYEERISLLLYLHTDIAEITNEEIICYSSTTGATSCFLRNLIIIDNKTNELIKNSFKSEPLYEQIFKQCSSNNKFYNIINPINFLSLSQDIINKLLKEEEEKIEKEIMLEAELKKLRRDRKIASTFLQAEAIDDIGKVLKNDINEINQYIQKRTTDRELIKNIEKLLSNVYKRFIVETSKSVQK